MNICKSLISIFSGRRLLILLTALMLASGLVFNQGPEAAFARPFNPPDDKDDRIIVNPPEFRPPENGFTWSVPARYGLNETDDGLMDTYWRAGSFDYDPAYIYPDTWPMQFFGCQTGPDAEVGVSTTNTYEWNIAGDTVNDGHCFFTYNGFTQQGTYPVTLTFTPQDGTPVSFTQEVYIRDYFLVAIGDSLASGEGNPDVRQQVVPTDPFGGWIPGSPARWQDQRCHRTAYAYPSKAAIDLEYSDPHTSVTFISFACSGATIFTPAWDPKVISWIPPFPPSFDLSPDPNKYRGTGILGSYIGNDWGDYNQATFIPPQIVQLQAALNPPEGKTARQFDALIISAGGNDLHFGDIGMTCLFDGSCWPDALVWENPTLRVNMELLVNRALTPFADGGSPYSLPDAFAALHDHIAGNEIKQIPALDPQPNQVYITQYADQTRNNNGGYCRMLDDVFWPLDLAATPDESQALANAALNGLNQAILDAADLYGWQYVDGITTYEDPVTGVSTPGPFVVGPDGRGHGYCASDNWIVRADESEKIQGPWPLRFATKGTLHPNLKGIQVLKDRLLHYLRPDLEATLPGNPPGDPPTFSSSFTSGELTSQPGANGWFTKSCDSTGNCSDQVVLQVTATGSAPLASASVYLNDSDQAGCSIAGVTCPRTVITPTNEVKWDFTFTTDGIYQMQFSASDSNNLIADYQSEIKVDLQDPFFALQPGPYSLDEGSSIMLTVVASDTNSAILNIDWDLDNDSKYETTDEQPAFSAAALDGPLSKTVGVLVTDEAGRSATATTTINVLNVAPTATINGAPATSPEGVAISLTSTVTDPGTADAFTYNWVAKKDGSNYASSTNANFIFTPDDNGSYEVSLSVSDDDGGVGTASQTIAVTNVAPALSNVTVSPATVNEGASVTLSGSISDAGSADAFVLTIDWGDGGTPELLSLPAGSTSFSRSHTYADDNPTGTSSDTNNVVLSLADDDGGKGTGSASVVVNNLAPSLSIAAPESGSLYAINATVNLSTSLSDASSLDTLTCSVNWDDDATASGTLAAGICTASHVYTAAGVYTIQMTATDDDTGAKTESVMVVIYDPSAGFVTGGGWIDSPAGAYTADPTLAGRAGFGFVSKYQKGANLPSGKTEFQFQAGSFYFKSEAYDWLVVSGAKAQFKGTGSVNGVSGYGFLLTLTDGQINGGGGVDKFRIKIWDANGVVYDNMIEYPDDMDVANPQAIGGGSIVIHSK
jgi:hypothetical protein